MSDKKKNWFARHKVLTVILIVIALGVIGSASGADKTKTENKASGTDSSSKQKEAAQKPAEPVDPHPNFKDGNYVVGTEIKAGIYRTRTGSSGCYFSRLAGFTGELSDILANENTDNPAIVEIKPTDKGFKSERCGKWTQDLSAITKSQTSFEDGMYIIGTDIQAGTYKSSGQSGCYYSRLSGFSGDLGEILANDNTDTSAIVKISPSDKGFKSTRCGTWTKIQ